MNTVLVLEPVAPLAWAINTALIAVLQDIKPGIQIVVCTSIPIGKYEESTTLIPKIDEIIKLIEESDLILVSKDLWRHQFSDFTDHFKNKHVIVTSPDRINGYNYFPEKYSLLRNHDQSRYMDAMVNLRTMVTAGLEPLRKPNV